MIVYRVEKYGLGPYSGREPKILEMITKHQADEYPNATEDCGFFPNHICGFSSLKDLRWWFDGFLDDLIILGYKIRRFKVDLNDVQCGSKQLVFKRPKIARDFIKGCKA